MDREWDNLIVKSTLRPIKPFRLFQGVVEFAFRVRGSLEPKRARSARVVIVYIYTYIYIHKQDFKSAFRAPSKLGHYFEDESLRIGSAGRRAS